MTAVIIGATGTTGSCLARRLVAAGKPVFLVGRDNERLQELATELNARYATADLSSSDSLIEAVTSAGPLASFVNCVGSILLKPAHLTSDAEFREVVETNLFTSFATVKCAGGEVDFRTRATRGLQRATRGNVFKPPLSS